MNKIRTNAKTPWYSGNNRPIVLLDMDDVITDCLKAVIASYNEKYNTKFKPKDCNVWSLSEFFGTSIEDVLVLFRADKFFEDLAPKRGSIKAIKDLVKSTKYDIYVITATSDEDGSELQQKIRWFNKYIPEFNTKRIISCQDKYVIRGDVIVDDKIDNLDLCDPYMECILMDSPVNKNCDKYIRIKNLRELPELLDKMFYENDIKTFEKEYEDELIKETNKR